MIHLIIAGTVHGDSVFLVNLPFHFRGNTANLFGISRHTEILSRHCKCIAGSQLLIRNDWRRLLGKGEWGEKEQKNEGSGEHRQLPLSAYWSSERIERLLWLPGPFWSTPWARAHWDVC